MTTVVFYVLASQEMAAPLSHRYGALGELMADSTLFPADRGPPFPRDLTAQDTELLPPPIQRRYEVSRAITLLNRREVYRQSVLIVERGVARVPRCLDCTEARSNPWTVVYFRGCYTAGPGKCAECLRSSGRKCRWPGGSGGATVAAVVVPAPVPSAGPRPRARP